MDKGELIKAIDDQIFMEDAKGNKDCCATLFKVRDFLKNTVTMEEIIDEVGKLWFGSEGRSDPDQQGYIGLCLSGESGELTEVILESFINAHIGKLNNYIKKELRSTEFREDKQAEIESEIPDIIFYLARLIAIRKIVFNRIWHIKMNHNEIKYGRPITDRPFYCKCDKCLDKLLEAKAL